MSSSGDAPLLPGALQKCLRMVDHARSSSPRVAQLLRRIEAAGCELGAGGAPVVCEDVFGAARVAGAYDHARRAIVMNPRTPEAFLNQGEWTRAVAHELVHAFDSCRAAVDPRNCRHIACTEVRAANLSGDCDFGVELARVGPARMLGFAGGGGGGSGEGIAGLGGGAGMSSVGSGLGGHQQRCVRRRAQLSLSMHPQCVEQAGAGAGDRRAARTVADVFDSCYNDFAPFATN